jgi:hypothetical protein
VRNGQRIRAESCCRGQKKGPGASRALSKLPRRGIATSCRPCRAYRPACRRRRFPPPARR